MSERLKKRSCQSGFLVNLPIFIVGVDRVIWWTLLLPKATCERGGKRVLLMKKAHIPLTKCFALSDFGWGSLCSALPSL